MTHYSSQAEYYQKNKEYYKEYHRRYQAEHKEELDAKRRERRARKQAASYTGLPLLEVAPDSPSGCDRCLWLQACRELVHRRIPVDGTWRYSTAPLPCDPGGLLKPVMVEREAVSVSVATGD